MKLTVEPLRQNAAGRGLASIDMEAAEEMGVSGGDYIRIEGETGAVVCRVWPGYHEDTGKGIVRIDGLQRQQIGAHVGEPVEVEGVEVEEAESIEIALPESLEMRGDFAKFIRNRIGDRVVTAGNTISISIGAAAPEMGDRFVAKVTDTTPGGDVVVTNRTTVTVHDRPVEQVLAQEEMLPEVTYEDIGGLDEELEQIREMVELPMRHPELFQQLGIEPPRGMLLHGPPGTGKTLIAKAVANEIDAYFTTISGPEIMGKYYGESEEQLREIFEEASENKPAIIFIDEIDSIAPKRDDTGGDVERRIVAQLLSLMDGLEERGDVVVIGATNRVDSIDPALRRGGRFDREIEVGIPDQNGRKEVLHVHTRGMPLADNVDIDRMAERTHGFVGADIAGLVKEAAMSALRRVRPHLDLEKERRIDADVLEELEVTRDDFKRALTEVSPSALREVFVEVPNVTWDDVGGLEGTQRELREMIQWPLDFPEVFEEMKMQAPKGVLLYGPPGTGKTLMAKAIANESESNFISIKGPELLNKFVGESERGVREVFEKARENAPTIVFFDEIDSIAGQRGQSVGDSGVGERVVSQLLTELDGLEALEDVVVIATTNRPDLIDSALLRPGRLDRHVHVPVPDTEAREKILEVQLADRPIGDGVSVEWLARETDGFVGADIEALVREASMNASRRVVGDGEDKEAVHKRLESVTVTRGDFEEALGKVTASVDEELREEYQELEDEMKKVEEKKETLSRSFQ